jgi:hypothetical protein
MPDFHEAVEFGRLGECFVVAWLQTRGYGVIPSYEYTGKNGEKAPRLLFQNAALTIPDLDVCKAGARSWLEIKTYHGPAVNTRRGALVHGIPSRLARDYSAVEKETGTPVFIVVLELDVGALLASRLATLTPMWPCTCAYCEQRGPGPCQSPIKEGVYWPRAAMQRLHRFSDSDLKDIRAAHARIGRPPCAKST